MLHRRTNLSIRSCFIRRFDRKVSQNLDEATEYRRKREKRKSMAMNTNPQIGRFSDVDATNEAEQLACLTRAECNFLKKRLSSGEKTVTGRLVVVAERPIDLAEDQVGQIDTQHGEGSPF